MKLSNRNRPCIDGINSIWKVYEESQKSFELGVVSGTGC